MKPETDSTAYNVGEIVGAILVLLLLALVVRAFVRGEVPLRVNAVLLAIGGILLAMTLIGWLFLAMGLTK